MIPTLNPVGAPVDELDGPLGLDGGDDATFEILIRPLSLIQNGPTLTEKYFQICNTQDAHSRFKKTKFPQRTNTQGLD